MTKLKLFALIASSLVVGCASEPTSSNRRLLSDLDGDGVFASEECGDASTSPGGSPGDEPDGPPEDFGDAPAPPPSDDDGCVIVPYPGDCTYVEVSDDGCYQCLDADGTLIGSADCTVSSDPVSCDLAEERDDGTVCWTCTSGDDSYTECYAPPVTCETDAQCAEGEICVVPDIGCDADDEVCPAIAGVGVCVTVDEAPTPGTP